MNRLAPLVALLLALPGAPSPAVAQAPAGAAAGPPPQSPPSAGRNRGERLRPRPGEGMDGPILPYNPGFDDARRDRGARAQGRTFLYRGEPRPRIRTAPYRWPRGFYYAERPARTVLSPALLLRNYALDRQERRRFGFAEAGPGELWLRVGDDSLRVRADTGEILESVRQTFY